MRSTKKDTFESSNIAQLIPGTAVLSRRRPVNLTGDNAQPLVLLGCVRRPPASYMPYPATGTQALSMMKKVTLCIPNATLCIRLAFRMPSVSFPWATGGSFSAFIRFSTSGRHNWQTSMSDTTLQYRKFSTSSAIYRMRSSSWYVFSTLRIMSRSFTMTGIYADLI